jgi:hypothetical protein
MPIRIFQLCLVFFESSPTNQIDKPRSLALDITPPELTTHADEVIGKFQHRDFALPLESTNKVRIRAIITAILATINQVLSTIQ